MKSSIFLLQQFEFIQNQDTFFNGVEINVLSDLFKKKSFFILW